MTGIPDLPALLIAGALAASSRHPLARALVAGAGAVQPLAGVVEHPGQGMSLMDDDGEIRLGRNIENAGLLDAAI